MAGALTAPEQSGFTFSLAVKEIGVEVALACPLWDCFLQKWGSLLWACASMQGQPALSTSWLVVTMGRTGVLFGRVLGLRQQRQRGLGASQVGSTAQVQTVHLIESWTTGRWALLPAGRQSSFKCPFGNLALSRFTSLYVTQDK